MGENSKRTFVNWENINADKMLYAKLFYTDAHGNKIETKVNISSCGTVYLFLRLNKSEKLNISYPQNIQIKIVTYETMYQAETVLKEIIYHSDWTCFSVEKPARLERIQEREYFRVYAENQTASIYYTDTYDKIKEFRTTIADVSIKSIKIYDLLYSDGKTVPQFNFDTVKNIRVKMYFDVMRDIILPVKFIEYRVQDGVSAYIFSFLKLSDKEEYLLSKLLSDIQRMQLHNSKNN